MGRPDTGWSWVIAFAAAFNSLILAGIFRTGGILFVAFIKEFGVSREQASWPVVLCISVLNLTGIVSGPLGQRFGVRPVCMVGAVVATAGMSSCYLTTSLGTITLLFGIVFGVGYGLISTLMPVAINTHFLERRATANGIANSGSCFGSIILPPLFEYLIFHYGLSGCFLLTGAFVFHTAVAGALMRDPPWNDRMPEVEKTVPPVDIQCQFQKNAGNQVGAQSVLSRRAIRTCGNADGSDGSENCGYDGGFRPSVEELEKSFDDLHQVYNTLSRERPSDLRTQNYSETEAVPDRGCAADLLMERGECDGPCEVLLLAQDGGVASRPNAEQVSSKDLVSTFACFRRVLRAPQFYTITVTNVSFYFMYHMFVVVIADFALDVGVPEPSAKYVLFAFAGADLAGRLCFGWVTDSGLLGRHTFVMSCMGLIGILFAVLPFARGLFSLAACGALYGLLLGCTMVVFPILLVDAIGLEMHGFSMGCMCFCNGLATLSRPAIIGYFRDSFGSYTNVFYILAAISLASSSLLLAEIVVSRWISREPHNNGLSCLPSRDER